MNIEDIRRKLRDHQRDLEAEGVRSLAVFGSTARGEAEAGSDIDLLVDFDPRAGVGLIRLLGLQDRLSRLLGQPVDLISRDSLGRPIRDRVNAEAQQVF
jgi:predicted nucleotidyltransferase